MPQTAEATKEQLEKSVVNPAQDQSPTIVHVTLKFDGVEFKPVELYEALDSKYGTVTNEKDTVSRGTYSFRVSE
jgi:hypothetical protein